MQDQRHRQQAGGAPAPAQPSAQPPSRQQPAFLSYSQERQQQEQQQLVRQQHFRQQQLRVPFWARRMAQDLLLDMARLEAGCGGAAVGAPGSALAELGLTEGMLQELHSLLPPFQAQDSTAAARQGERGLDAAAQQQEQHGSSTALPTQQQAGDVHSPASGQQLVAGEATPPSPGDVFAAELSSILSHYQQSTAVGSTKAAGAEAKAGAEAAPVPAGTEAGTSDRLAPARQQRTVDAGGFLLLLRALALMVSGSRLRPPQLLLPWHRRPPCSATWLLPTQARAPGRANLQGEGMRSALAALLAAQRHSGAYPVCSPDLLAPLLRLSNTMMEV
jgi:hypothetical protein